MCIKFYLIRYGFAVVSARCLGFHFFLDTVYINNHPILASLCMVNSVVVNLSFLVSRAKSRHKNAWRIFLKICADCFPSVHMTNNKKTKKCGLLQANPRNLSMVNDNIEGKQVGHSNS